MARKRKNQLPPTDGLGPKELKSVRDHVRKAWTWSTAYRLAKKRAHVGDGLYRCENPECKHKKLELFAQVAVDHIGAVGPVQAPHYIKRMFVPSKYLRVVCRKSHARKTAQERKDAAKAKQAKAGKDFSFL
jgi:hypothetical protein